MDYKAGHDVRLRYSGFIVFLSRLASVGTGLLFILMVTRNLTTEEFGIFGNLGDTLGYFTLVATMVPFWTTRFLARRHWGASKTGLIANFILSMAFSMLYILLLSAIISTLQIKEAYRIVYAALTFQIVETYAISELEAILQAGQPQLIGFGFLVFEACKVVSVFFLVFELKLGLLGAACSIIIGCIVQIVFYLRFVLHELREPVKWSYVKEWLKASPVNIYGTIGQRLVSFVLILLFVYGGESARAYYGAATTFAGVITYTSSLAFALYPRLLSKNDPEDVSISLRMVSTFTIPMTFGVIVLSDSYLTILNPTYCVARSILILLSISYACLSISSVFSTVIIGTESFDTEAKIIFKELVKSGLFLVSSLSYVESALMIPLTYFTLTTIAKGAIEAASALAFITLLTNICMLFLRYITARKFMRFSLPWGSLGKYTLSSVVMAVILYVFPSPTRLSPTLALTLFGGLIYFSVLSAIDRETRSIAISAKQELTQLFKKRVKPQD